MDPVEVTTELADTARYFIGSEALVDPGSLPYGAIVEELGNMSGSDEQMERLRVAAVGTIRPARLRSACHC